MDEQPIVVVGGGVVGLATGWELARHGATVTLLDRGRVGRGTSWLAAGMLAPDAEIQFEELGLYALSRESLRRWPAFAQSVEEASGQRVDYRTEGTLVVADDRDSAEALRRLYDFQREQGLEVKWLSGREALRREPFLAPRLTAAVYAPSDHQVDNRRLLEALRTAFERAGGTVWEETPVRAVEPERGASPAAAITEDGARFEGSAVLVAAGVWCERIEGVRTWLGGRSAVRPVKGQMLQLQMTPGFDLQHVVRGPDAYLAPKSDGRLLVGATSEEMGFDTDVTAGGLYALLEGGWEVVPGILDLAVTETWAGLRPASRDHAPLVGRVAPGVVVATGHYRHGILLAPVTAQEVAHLVRGVAEGRQDLEPSRWLAPFDPSRLAARPAPAAEA